jgi:hypothetical protein
MEIDEEDDVLFGQNRRAIALTIAIATMRPDPVPENTCPFTKYKADYLIFLSKKQQQLKSS